MKIKERKIKGVYEIELNPSIDDRGYFMRTYDKILFKDFGLDKIWVQENHSKTNGINTIRGLHFQLPPFSETKLIRCIRGKVLDVYVDLRKDSQTFSQWESIELSEDNFKSIFIPAGFAHGFCTKSEISEVINKVDNIYNKDFENGIIWNDKTLKIDWQNNNPVLSEKDSALMTFKEFVQKHHSIESE